MAAYMIIIAQIHDRERFLADYGKPAAELVARHGGEYVVRAPGAEALEGTIGDGASIVVSRWPDADAARGFWESEAYRRLKEKRRDLADCQVLLVENP